MDRNHFQQLLRTAGAICFVLATATTAPAQNPSTTLRPDVRVRGVDVSESVERYLKQVPASGVVRGELTREPDGLIVLTPSDDPSVTIPLGDEEPVQPAALQVPVAVTLEGEGESRTVKEIDLSATANWNARSADGLGLGGVNAAMERLRAVTSESFSTASTEGRERLADEVARTGDAISEAYRELLEAEAPSEADRRALVETWAEVKVTEKALYGRRDIYRPEAYERIFKNSRGVGALAMQGEPRPDCTAFLVGKDAVLTAAHCIRDAIATELEVRFNYEQALTDTMLDKVAYPVTAVLARGAKLQDDEPPLDFVLLRLGRAANGQLPGEAWPIQCITSHRVRRDDPIYVVGHPLGDPRSVHDNAFVLFPFVAVETEYARLRLAVEAEMRNASDMERDQALAAFERSYRKKELAGGQVAYQLFSERWRQPVIAADCDTYGGNSGSPVFSRKAHTVVGILIGGQEDRLQQYDAGWKQNEAILPGELILQQLASNDEWKALEGRCSEP